MKLGECPSCFAKIGTRTANRIFVYDRTRLRQIVLKYIDPDWSDVNANFFYFHVPVCKKCAVTPDIATIETSIADDTGVIEQRERHPNAVYDSFTEERIS